MSEIIDSDVAKPYGVIYKWTNKISGKAYIGQTTQDPEERKAEHLYPSSDSVISRAIRKHGIENFDFEVIDSTATNQEELDAREKYWSEYYHTWIGGPECWGYNVRECGGGHGRYPPEIKATMRHSQSAETREKISNSKQGRGVGEDNSFYGRHHSEETKHLLREKAKVNNSGDRNPMYGKRHSDETKRKMSDSHYDCSGVNNPRARKTQCVETGQVFDCQKDAAEWAKVPKSRICLACKNPSSSSGGYHWRTI